MTILIIIASIATMLLIRRWYRESLRRKKHREKISKIENDIHKSEREIQYTNSEILFKRNWKRNNQDRLRYGNIYYSELPPINIRTENEFPEPLEIKSKPISEHPVLGFMLDLGFTSCEIDLPDMNLDMLYRNNNLDFQMKLMKSEYEKNKSMSFKINNN